MDLDFIHHQLHWISAPINIDNPNSKLPDGPNNENDAVTLESNRFRYLGSISVVFKDSKWIIMTLMGSDLMMTGLDIKKTKEEEDITQNWLKIKQ